MWRWAGLLSGMMLTMPLSAGEVEVRHARFVAQGQTWTVSVTLYHADTGWEHYADGWRIVALITPRWITSDGTRVITASPSGGYLLSSISPSRPPAKYRLGAGKPTTQPMAAVTEGLAAMQRLQPSARGA